MSADGFVSAFPVVSYVETASLFAPRARNLDEFRDHGPRVFGTVPRVAATLRYCLAAPNRLTIQSVIASKATGDIVSAMEAYSLGEPV